VILPRLVFPGLTIVLPLIIKSEDILDETTQVVLVQLVRIQMGEWKSILFEFSINREGTNEKVYNFHAPVS
jgi:hypothetical protein